MNKFKYRNINFNIFYLEDKHLVTARYKGKMRACYVETDKPLTFTENSEKRLAYEGIKKVHNAHLRIKNKNKARRAYKLAM
jgi:hypothetical protein